MSMLTVLSSVALGLMSWSRHLLNRSDQRTDRNRQMTRLYTAFSEQFYHSSSTYIVVSPQGDKLSVATARDLENRFHTGSQGYPQWLAWESTSVESDLLVQRRSELTSLSEPPDPTKIVGQPSARRVLARGLQDFRTALRNDGSVEIQLDWGTDSKNIEKVHWSFRPGQGVHQ